MKQFYLDIFAYLQFYPNILTVLEVSAKETNYRNL